ncbi:cupin-like domain-containing protein [Pseudobacteriovorax antillogorgiicola]|uniref:Cupin-like domain-containing protein n=1 Tax=Pseudobacteriovorax antillogorgiicola TaxID=1513793 RepID=A0A1Y6BSE4_9BACT|nr:cupin-like domain-containing protein [Pseudobacteriovorax antillogorgiicola]TCS54538.1 cupin-like protein [Pseudobacteriovorax antillogorgiicola]SMF18635.1 Cupin-like domain-containing protein [Pseudobacteriovorax antillogorgiicola]
MSLGEEATIKAAYSTAQNQNLMVYDYKQINPQILFRDHIRARKPALIKNAVHGSWAPWSWTISSLVQRYGDKSITYRSPAGDQVGDLANVVEKALGSNNEKVYLRNLRIVKDLPELADELFPLPDILRGDWKSTFLLPNNWLLGKHIIELFVSKPGITFPVLHLDYWGMDGFICQVEGHKQFVLFSPDDTPYLYPTAENPLLSAVDPFQPDFNKHPEFKNASMVLIDLEPGDVLYNPGWWHTTKTLSQSLTIIFSTWNSGNWGQMIRELVKANFKSEPSKSAVIASYLALVAIPLFMWEQWRIKATGTYPS